MSPFPSGRLGGTNSSSNINQAEPDTTAGPLKPDPPARDRSQSADNSDMSASEQTEVPPPEIPDHTLGQAEIVSRREEREGLFDIHNFLEQGTLAQRLSRCLWSVFRRFGLRCRRRRPP